ncbi:unnamed protein product [Cochlearia groenlandica]
MVLTHTQYWSKQLSRNPQAFHVILLLFCFILCTPKYEASRASSPSSVFYTNPSYDHYNNNNTILKRRDHFLGFFPRHLPIPVSGPSRKHNDIGIQAFLSP